MTTTIVRLNASALFALGMDKPTVEALQNMIYKTGTDTAGPTLPQIDVDLTDTKETVVILREQVDLLQSIIDILESAPPPKDFDTSLLDAFAVAPKEINVPQVEALQTEVRQLAEQLAVTNGYIQELRQGTML